MKRYKVLIHSEAYKKAHSYLTDLSSHKLAPGFHLQAVVKDKDLAQLSVSEFIELLVRTKRPQIFAESAVHGNGSDWNQTELSILGDISIAVPVAVFDNGLHRRPKVHQTPFGATLLYTPGALLRNGTGHTPADWGKVTVGDEISYAGYYALYERRLLPPLLYANSVANANQRKAFITVPGLGCGQFAGRFGGKLGSLLRKVLLELLSSHAELFRNIAAVYYDPYLECENERVEIGGLSFMVRPLTKGNASKAQLCEPEAYQEGDDRFRDCELFSVVAWDHVSWPGNDFYIGSRSTDDGVKAAATSSMAVITGIEGQYDASTNTYDPPEQNADWEMVVRENGVQIDVKDNLVVLPEPAKG